MKHTFRTSRLALALLAASFATRTVHADDVYILKFAPWVQDTASAFNASGLEVIRHFPEIGAYVVKVKDKDLFKHQKAELERNSQYLQPDQKVKIDAIPNDAYYGDQDRMREMNVEKAWDLATGSKDILVAISDTGINFKHPDIKNQIWTNPKEIPGNGIDDDGNGFVDDVHGWDFVNNDNVPDDQHGHGTHVAGIIGAEGNNKVGLAGVNWKTSILPVKFLDGSGQGTNSGGIATMIYAANMGAKVLNCSWGGGGYDQAMMDAIEYGLKKGMLTVSAAGNDSEGSDMTPHYPSSFESLGILAVASSQSPGYMSYFSNMGHYSVDVVAPGENVISTVYDNNYLRWSGTSMASPMVTGTAALMLSARPDLTPMQLRNGLLNATVQRKGYSDWISTGGDMDTYLAIKQLGEGFQIWPHHVTLKEGVNYPFTAWAAKGKVTWTASPAETATIDQDGVLTTIQEGLVNITATDETGTTVKTEKVEVIVDPRTVGCDPNADGKSLTPKQSASAAISMLGLPMLAAFIGTRKRRRRPSAV